MRKKDSRRKNVTAKYFKSKEKLKETVQIAATNQNLTVTEKKTSQR